MEKPELDLMLLHKIKVHQTACIKGNQTAYIDVRVFNPFAQSNADSSLPKCYRKHEQESEYEERICETEYG